MLLLASFHMGFIAPLQKKSDQKQIVKRSVSKKRKTNVEINLDEISDDNFLQNFPNSSAQKDNEREKKKRQRMNETEEEHENRNKQDQERKKKQRTNETVQERENRTKQNQENMKKQRMNETEQEHENRKMQDQERKKKQRINETELEREIRIEEDQERKKRQRMNETEYEREQRLKENRKIKQRNREAKDHLYACANHADVVEHKLGPMNIKCKHCKSVNFLEEKVTNRENEFKNCCHYGKALCNTSEKDFPELLKNLFMGTETKSRNFFDSIRYLNSSVSVASMNPIKYKYPNNRGPYCFRIFGQIYHKINVALHPDTEDQPSFGQLFIVDTGEAMNALTKDKTNVDKDLLKTIYELIKDINPFAKAFVMMAEEEEEEQKRAEHEGRAPNQVKLLFNIDKKVDNKRYNMPRANEVAAVFIPGADGEIPQSRIIIRERGKELKYLSSTDPNVVPMCYPLFFPNGNQGWHPGLKQKNGKTISRLQYASNCIAFRDGQFNPLLYGRKLYQQWCVDEYVKIEGDRMRWIKANQKKIMADSYKNVDSFLSKKSKESGLPIGRKIILPASITGSPRYIEKHFQDAMCMVRRFGKPDLFITMTCNPKWEEIQNNLFIGQNASDRPDIVDRVFHLKMKVLMEDVKTKVFGMCISWMYTVEFQMRGLPHIHLLITLADKDKLRDGNDVDERGICAKIPDKNTEPELYELVKKHMVHGPCGLLNPNSPCMQETIDGNGKKVKRCSKNYPKAFRENTIMLENGFADYARPDDGNFIEINMPGGNVCKVDNRWVVPHIPYLLRKYHCHINVEKVNSVSSVKYLHAYIHKGPVRTEMILNEPNAINHDEVQQFLDARCICPTDAVWRILEFPNFERSHSIKMLPIHLPGEQMYYFEDGMSEEELREKINSNTELMAYFELNKKDDLAKEKYYHEIPEFFIFEKGKWRERVRFDISNKNSKIIGRLVKVLPSELERYYLRLLLLHKKSAKSFDELKTVDNVLYQSYAEACLAKGLIRNDEEWIKGMEEANSYMMPSQLRLFISLILVHCGPSKPEELWEKFKDALSEDFQRKYSKNISYNYALMDIAKKILEAGKKISDFATMPKLDTSNLADEPKDLNKILEKGIKMYEGMNEDQQAIVDEILDRIENPVNKPNFYFLSGAGGVGKTHVNKSICYQLEGKGKKVATMAFTGIAANLLPAGRTLHNRFGLFLDMSCSKISPNTIAWNELKNTDLFIIDEAPMVDKIALEVIDSKLKEIMQNKKLFGNKPMVWTGDFRQGLPIKNHATRAQIVDSTIKRSKFWKYVKKLNLTKNMRALPNEQAFAKDLLDIGEGKTNDENDDIILPEHCICKGSLEEEIFKDVITSQKWDKMAKMAILAPKNIDVSESNQKVLDMLPGEERYYPSIDHAENEVKQREDDYLDEFLHTLTPSGFPPHELRLKKFATVMLLRNLNICNGLCNGTRMMILDMKDNVLICKTIEKFCDECTNKHEVRMVYIPRITLCCDNEYPFNLYRHQFPVKLAFSMSITKSQGQTLEKCGIDLRKNVFCHGMLYVGLSRVRAWNALKIKIDDDNVERKVKNIVYKEILD